MPVSVRILTATIALQAVVGLALAIYAALRRRTISDLAVYATAILLVSVPVIVSALALQAFVGFRVGGLPSTWRPDAGWTNYVLPVASLAAGFAAYVLLIARTELLPAIREPHMRAAVARGVPERRLIGVHASRASLVPVVTFVTPNLGNLIAGLVVVEGVFGVPGSGGRLFLALQTQDRALIVVIIILVLVTVIVVNTIADIAYSAIDPRIRLDGQ